MTVLADDFDLDDDDDEDEICNHFFGNKCSTWIWVVASDVRKLEGNKSSDLLRGQVRRYSPRNNLSDSHNYTLLSIMKSGVDLFHAIFFMQFTQLLIKSLISNEKTAFFNLAHGHCI